MQRLGAVTLVTLALLARETTGSPPPRRPAAAPSAPAAAAAAAAARPNFLIIVSDDQRWDTFSRAYMPLTFARLVDRGVRFSSAYVTTSLCCPSRSSILTGLYARHHGVRDNDDPLTRATVAQRLHAAGYYTALVGKYINSFNHLRGRLPEFDFTALGGNINQYYNPPLNVNGQLAVRRGYITYLLRDYALQFLRQAPRDRPFLLLFTPNAPHEPADPAPGDGGLYPGLAPYRPPSFNEADVSDKPAWLRARPPLRAIQVDSIDRLRRKQLQSLRALDRAVGALLDALRAEGRLDDTFVLFLSDNGYLWGEHRLHTKPYVYDETHRVPLAVRYPPLAAGPRADAHLVANVDIAPTLYELAGLPIPPEVDGRSLVPLLRGAAPWRDALLLEGWPLADGSGRTYQAIRTQRYAYIETRGDAAELYDLQRDPYQLENVASRPEYAALVSRLRTRLATEF
jgi:N-acetylglucosamine-6-sulfatase